MFSPRLLFAGLVPAGLAARRLSLPARAAAASAVRGPFPPGSAVHSSASAAAAAAAAAATPPHWASFFVKRAGDASFAEVVVPAGASVAALQKAAVAELRLDVPPTAVTLTRSGADAPLDGTQSIGEALAAGTLAPRAKLLLQVHSSPRMARMPAVEAPGMDTDARMMRLAEALRAARAEPIAGAESGAALVTLPVDVVWPQLGGKPLFVRSFYEGCFEGVLNSLDPGGTAAVRKFTVIGNAGIGKSAFGAYVLWRAVQAQRTVVYVSDKVHEAFILHGDGRAEAFTADQFNLRTRGVLSARTTVLICDGVKPPIVDAFTLLITSPVRERWKEFNKASDARRLCFPVFSRAETGDMLRSCFPRLVAADAASGGEAGVWARFDRWGGVPRYVLDRVDADAQLSIGSALSRISVDALVSRLGDREIESDDVVSHRLMHLKPAGEAADGAFTCPRDVASYLLVRSELGSPFIKDLVYRAMEEEDIRRIEALLARQSTSPTFAKLYGDVFERAALDMLREGGSFPLFDLTTGAEAGLLVLRPSDVVVFATAPNLAASVRARDAAALAASIFLPKAANYTGVDAVLGDGRALVNFTIDTAHDLKPAHSARAHEGPAALASALGYADGEEIRFYWVLPPSRYADMCRRGRPKKSVRLPLAGGGSVAVRQFALRVPFRAAPAGVGAP
jgi:hypothetical protein